MKQPRHYMFTLFSGLALIRTWLAEDTQALISIIVPFIIIALFAIYMEVSGYHKQIGASRMSDQWREAKSLTEWQQWTSLDFNFWLGYYRGIEFSDDDKEIALMLLELLNRSGLGNTIQFRYSNRLPLPPKQSHNGDEA